MIKMSHESISWSHVKGKNPKPGLGSKDYSLCSVLTFSVLLHFLFPPAFVSLSAAGQWNGEEKAVRGHLFRKLAPSKHAFPFKGKKTGIWRAHRRLWPLRSRPPDVIGHIPVKRASPLFDSRLLTHYWRQDWWGRGEKVKRHYILLLHYFPQCSFNLSLI